jgi:hypothetical protein
MGYNPVTILLQTRFSILQKDGRSLGIKINSSSAKTHEFPRDHVVDSDVLPYFAYIRFIHLVVPYPGGLVIMNCAFSDSVGRQLPCVSAIFLIDCLSKHIFVQVL